MEELANLIMKNINTEGWSWTTYELVDITEGMKKIRIGGVLKGDNEEKV